MTTEREKWPPTNRRVKPESLPVFDPEDMIVILEGFTAKGAAWWIHMYKETVVGYYGFRGSPPRRTTFVVADPERESLRTRDLNRLYRMGVSVMPADEFINYLQRQPPPESTHEAAAAALKKAREEKRREDEALKAQGIVPKDPWAAVRPWMVRDEEAFSDFIEWLTTPDPKDLDEESDDF